MDALFSCFKEAIGVLRKRKARLISDGRGSRSCSSETRLRQAVLFNVLPRVYRRDFRIVGIPPVFPATDFRRAFAASYRSSVFYRILSSGGVSAGVFQRIYVRYRYRDSAFFVRNRRFLYFFNLRFADGAFNVCAACDCLYARRRNMQKTSARVRKRRNFLFFFIASHRRDGLRACRNIAGNNHFSPRKQNFLKISYNFFSDSGN